MKPLLFARLLVISSLLLLQGAFQAVAATEPKASPLLLIGELEYERYQLVVSNVEGVLSRLHIRGGQDVDKQQLLANVTSLEYGVKEQQFFNGESALRVAEIYLQEGDKVEKFQPIMRLADTEHLHVVAPAFYPQASNVSIGQSAKVVFDPDNAALTIDGQVSGIHHLAKDSSHAKVEIRLDLGSCESQVSCRRYLKPRMLSKVIIQG
ncbi:HlyD family secretion protein [Pseudoalteromonas sp. DL2-H2.2]|uniref:HlyD family secretion protein n=1 Tax=Pseudoalteromonas sp. DL2-H2.2 TaxID=2908889 RepID=UPI001F27DB40|nr:HlyD family secretion protein [Pseudoalteromonas sp. DL2-H2.2]MCF2907564.1 HlyD family secretion protein [Pseudoalteromonas sp. DL2-H2.2]